jgi:hypothetical protein
MNKDDAQKANTEWHELKNSLPSGVELVGEYDHAWGIEYNGFLLFEADSSDSSCESRHFFFLHNIR